MFGPHVTVDVGLFEPVRLIDKNNVKVVLPDPCRYEKTGIHEQVPGLPSHELLQSFAERLGFADKQGRVFPGGNLCKSRAIWQF